MNHANIVTTTQGVDPTTYSSFCEQLPQLNPSSSSMSSTSEWEWLSGSCHCRAIRFQVAVVRDVADAFAFEVRSCNCSMCSMKALMHLIVPPERFRFSYNKTVSPTQLSTYTFNTNVAKHHFCSTCGMHPFYRPRSHPHDYDVNARCLDLWTQFQTIHEETISESTSEDVQSRRKVLIRPFDGAHWEQNVALINPTYQANE